MKSYVSVLNIEALRYVAVFSESSPFKFDRLIQRSKGPFS